MTLQRNLRGLFLRKKPCKYGIFENKTVILFTSYQIQNYEGAAS